jgi:hypothetical protein
VRSSGGYPHYQPPPENNVRRVPSRPAMPNTIRTTSQKFGSGGDSAGNRAPPPSNLSSRLSGLPVTAAPTGAIALPLPHYFRLLKLLFPCMDLMVWLMPLERLRELVLGVLKSL